MTTQESEAVFLLKAADGEQQLLVDRELLMGRDESSDVVLDKGQASRKHAKLIPDQEGVWVKDLGSTNGTFVSGERISKPTLLKVGDELRCGESVFELAARPEAAAADPDATLLYNADDTAKVPSAVDAAPAAEAPPVKAPPIKAPAAQAAPVEKAQSEAALAEEVKPGQQPAEEAAPAAEPSDSVNSSDLEGKAKAPPSWVLNNQQSVDGTAFISKDMMKNSLLSSGNKAETQETVAEPTLVGNSDPVMGLRFQLIGEGKNKWEIGRSPNADIMLNDDSVSGAHAQILHEGGRWKLVDLMSANGTYANGKKCLTGYLASGDLVGFGGVECAFMLPEEEEAQQQAGDSPSKPEAPRVSMPRIRLPRVSMPRISMDSSALKTAAIAFGATAIVALGVILVIAQFI